MKWNYYVTSDIGLVFSFEKLHLLFTVNIFTKEKENFQSIGVNKTIWTLDNEIKHFIMCFLYSHYIFKARKQGFLQEW